MARRPHYEARYICPIGEQSKSILALRTPTPGLSLVCTFSSTEANGHANRRGIVSEAQRLFKTSTRGTFLVLGGYQDVCAVDCPWFETMRAEEDAFSMRGEKV